MAPWKSGQSGNPKGRPKGSFSFDTMLRSVLEGDTLGGEHTPDGRTVGEWFVEKIVHEAMKGNSPYMKEIVERLHGKTPNPAPLKPVEPDGADEGADMMDDEGAARILRAASGGDGPHDDEIIDVDAGDPIGGRS